MDSTKKPETRLSRALLQKQGNLVRVVGLHAVFTGTATVAMKTPVRPKIDPLPSPKASTFSTGPTAASPIALAKAR
jgi:hypothetical protein